MSVPGAVQTVLGDEQVAAQVALGSEDELYVTPTRTIIYRGDGLLSDEAVEEYTHDADQIRVSEGRRKARITLVDEIEGERSFTVPPNLLDDALHPVLAGVLNAAGVTEPGETVKRTFRFSELTVIVTSRRLLKHIGEAVWDVDYEEYHYENATGLDFEEGSVATAVVLEVDGRRERIKAPNDRAPELQRELETALLDFYDVDSIAEFEATVDPGDEPDEPESPELADEEGDISFESGISPLNAVQDDEPAGREERADPIPDDGGRSGGAGDGAGDSAGGTETADVGGDAGGTGAAVAGATGEPATEETAAESEPVTEETVTNEELAERMDELSTAVKRQNELLERHAHTIEQLIEELKRM